MTSRVLSALRSAPGRALAVHDGHRLLNYCELRDAVDGESRWLESSGVRRCALLADNGVGWIVADLALLARGALHVPLPQWFTRGQIDHVLSDAGVDFVLTDQGQRLARDHDGFTQRGVSPYSRLQLFGRERNVQAPRVPIDTAKITYTSGSTAAPKGVCLGLGAIDAVAQSLARATHVGVTRHLCAMPLSTLLENIAGVYAPILLGATCVVPSVRTVGIANGTVDPLAFTTCISRHGPHSLIVPPELLRVLVIAAGRGWLPPAELRFIAVGGAPVSAALLEEAAALGLPAYQGYGLSECASVVCLNTPLHSRRGSVGKPLPHAKVRVDEHSQILVRGAVMQGYLGHDADSSEEIATGDLGEIDADGYVYVRGRIKNMFITSMGRNVSPEWVEAELLREAGIGQAVVLGEGRPWPIALIHPAGPQFDAHHIDGAIAAANERLPDYARIRRWAQLPQALSFTGESATANGRARRETVAARYESLIDALYYTALAS